MKIYKSHQITTLPSTSILFWSQLESSLQFQLSTLLCAECGHDWIPLRMHGIAIFKLGSWRKHVAHQRNFVIKNNWVHTLLQVSIVENTELSALAFPVVRCQIHSVRSATDGHPAESLKPLLKSAPNESDAYCPVVRVGIRAAVSGRRAKEAFANRAPPQRTS
jgi:hypothetical protein